MSLPQTGRDRVRRPSLVWVLVAAGAIVLVAGSVVLATRRSTPSAPTPAASTRAVALGDSVPYGHGLHNPYPTPQAGLPRTWVSQGPSRQAYPSAVADALGLTMTVRPTNCTLTDDQLAISGAVADAADNTARDGQCLHPARQARNLSEEIAAAQLGQHPARLVLLQDGADDIDFASCLEYQLARAAGFGLGLGAACVQNGKVTPALATKLDNVRSSITRAIESIAPHAATVAVLDYYQPVPDPTQIVDDAAGSGGDTNLVCAGLRANAADTAAAGQVVLGALNDAVAEAVRDARADHVKNVTLVDVAHTMDGHGVCTADPWVFSGEPVPDSTLTADAGAILSANACDRVSALGVPCASLKATAARAEENLKGSVWRAVHPNEAGQQALARVVERRLPGRT